MVEQMEKKFAWVLKKFSSLQDDEYHSRPFSVAGYNWRLLAYPKGEGDGYLSLYLELVDADSLPPGWTRHVKFSLTVVSKRWGKSNKVLGGQCCFNSKDTTWGHNKVMSLTKLHAKGRGFLVKNRLIIVAQLHVFPEENVSIAGGPLSSKDENQADGKTEDANLVDDGASEEGSDDDDWTSDEGTDDDGSSEEDVDNGEVSSSCLDDGGGDVSLFNQFNALEDATDTAGNHGTKSNSVAEVSNDDAPKEDVSDEASNDSASNGTSLDQVKSLEDVSQTVENGVKGFNNVTSPTQTANNLISEIQPTKETTDVNGFDVFSSQVESVSLIFKRHPDIALGFRPKNRQIRKAYMNELLSLIEMLCQPPEKLSEDDLSNADDTLADLIDVGFKLDWLKAKVSEVSEKKKKEQSSGDRLRTMEEQLLELKLMFLHLETQLQMEKAEALAARAPLSFNDVVC